MKIFLTDEDRENPEVKKILDSIKAEQKKLKPIEARSAEMYRSGPYDVDEANRLGEQKWTIEQRIVKLARKINRMQDERAAQNDPVWVTWKAYGFRHISAVEVSAERTDYKGDEVTDAEGRAICGNDFWILGGEPSRSTERPLCGLCRKKWRALTGEKLP